MQRNALEEAEREFEIARKLEPKDLLTYQNLGEVYLAKQEYEKARAEFEKCLQMDPKYSPAHSGLGFIHLGKNDPVKAQACFETAVRFDRDNFDSHYLLGGIYMEQKRYDRAEQALRNAMRSEKYDYDPEAFSRLGTACLYQEKLDEAEKAFLSALKLDPENLGARNNLGIIYLRKNNLPRAEQVFRDLYQRNPEHPGICLMLAQVLGRNQKTIAEAISLYNKAIAIEPRNTQAYIDLAGLYLRAGDKANANRVLDRAAQTAPDNQAIRARVEALRKQ